jgi:sugar lactone lactonase YvrE
MRKFWRYFLILIAVLLAYFLFYPVNIEPVAWNPPAPPSLETGTFQQNDKLAAIKHLKVEGKAPEDIAIDTLNNKIYGGLLDGKIIRMNLDGSNAEVFANTQGRPLGLKFAPQGDLIVADAHKGLLSIDKKGKITVLSTEYGGVPFRFTDDLDIAQDGTIYFSDASSKFTFKDHLDYPLESGLTGRFLSYQPSSKKTTLLIDKMAFSNGIALSPDESFVLINETLRYRIWRYWLKGDKKGQKEIFIENLPGFPDGVLYNGKGIFWVAIVTPRDKTLDSVLPNPFIRKVLRRLPEALLPAPKNYGFILGLDENAQVKYNLQDPKGGFGQITNVVEHQGKLYLGTLHESAIGVIDVPK